MAVILEKLKAVNNKFTSLNKNAGEIESVNEIYFEQISRVLNTNEMIERYISQRSPFNESLLSKSIPSSKSRVNLNSLQSQISNSSSSSVSHQS